MGKSEEIFAVISSIDSNYGILRPPPDLAMIGVENPLKKIFEPSIFEQMSREDAQRRAMFSDTSFAKLMERQARDSSETDYWRNSIGLRHLEEEARRAAELSLTLPLPNTLNSYRASIDQFASNLTGTPTLDLWREPGYVAAFSEASALANLYDANEHVTRAIIEANRYVMHEPLAAGSLSHYRGIYDAAGLTLPHWPRLRLLTRAEKRRQFRARLNENVEPPHVRKAKSLVHEYERTLRDILDAAMAVAYGEEWPEERLPSCGCKDLLGKWKKRGGAVLDHADYKHYALIISHPEHFSAVFQAGFDDPSEAFDLLVEAGELRAASHHARPFTPNDLRALRVTWRTIEKALVALDDDYELEM